MFFANLGRWCFRHRGKVALLWLAALIVFGGISSMLGTAYSTEFALPDVESRRGFDILDEHFAGSGAGSEGGTIVFRTEQGVTDPEVQRAMTAYFDEASQIEGSRSSARTPRRERSRSPHRVRRRGSSPMPRLGSLATSRSRRRPPSGRS